MIAAKLTKAIEAHCKETGLTQSDAARIYGCTPPQWNSTIRGKKGVSLDTLVRMAESIGLAVELKTTKKPTRKKSSRKKVK